MTETKLKPLESLLEKIAKERAYVDFQLQITPTATDGANFSSFLYFATISSPGKPDLKLFAKLAVTGEKFRALIPEHAYLIEPFVYRTLAKVFENIQDKHQVYKELRLKMPVMYGCDDTTQQEVLVLQDLTAEGFGSLNRRDVMSWPYAISAITQLARLHSLFFVMQQEYPAEYEKACKLFQANLESIKPMMRSFEESIFKTIDLFREENRERVQTYFQDISRISDMLYQPLRRPILLHADFRINNMLHKVDENDDVQVTVVDYQTLHVGSVVKDLLYFIFLGSDAQFRRKYYRALVEKYYEELGLALGRLGHDVRDLFPREDFDYEFKTLQPLGLMVALMAMPAITAESQDVAPLTNDLDLAALMQVQASELCIQRINDIVDDYIEWGEL